MHYDNLFSGDMEYVLFIVKTLEENKRVSEILKSFGYFTENVECSIAGSIIKKRRWVLCYK